MWITWLFNLKPLYCSSRKPDGLVYLREKTDTAAGWLMVLEQTGWIHWSCSLTLSVVTRLPYYTNRKLFYSLHWNIILDWVRPLISNYTNNANIIQRWALQLLPSRHSPLVLHISFGSLTSEELYASPGDKVSRHSYKAFPFLLRLAPC